MAIFDFCYLNRNGKVFSALHMRMGSATLLVLVLPSGYNATVLGLAGGGTIASWGVIPVASLSAVFSAVFCMNHGYRINKEYNLHIRTLAFR